MGVIYEAECCKSKHILKNTIAEERQHKEIIKRVFRDCIASIMDLIDCLYILEDQMFLLEMPQEKPAMFLKTEELLDMKERLCSEIVNLDPRNDYFLASLLMRGICCCMALLGIDKKNDVTTLVQFSEIVDKQILFSWFETGSLTILSLLKKLVGFAASQNALLSPEAYSNLECHRCKMATAIHELQDLVMTDEGVANPYFCKHYLALRIQHDERKNQQQHKKYAEIDKGYVTSSLNKSIGMDKKLNAIKHLKEELTQILMKEEEVARKLREVTSPRGLSLGCCSDIAVIFLYLLRRMRATLYFSPSSSHESMPPVAAAYADEERKSKLQSALAQVVTTRKDRKNAMEVFDYLLLDPCTANSLDGKFLRSSILAKRFYLARGISAKQILNERAVWESMDSKTLMHSEFDSKKDRLGYAVMVIHIFNMWLDFHGHLSKSYHLTWSRGETVEPNILIALFENEQVGLVLGDSRFHATTSTILLMCITYLTYLENTLGRKFLL